MLIEVPKYYSHYLLLSRNCFQVFFNAFPNLVNLVSLNTESEKSHVFQIFFSCYIVVLPLPLPSSVTDQDKKKINDWVACRMATRIKKKF